MEELYIADKTFDKINFTEQSLRKGEYEHCTFMNCDLYNVNLGSCRFAACAFIACNLSMAGLTKTALMDVQFKDSKMLGLRFDACSDFGLSIGFDNCNLDHCSFYKSGYEKQRSKIPGSGKRTLQNVI